MCHCSWSLSFIQSTQIKLTYLSMKMKCLSSITHLQFRSFLVDKLLYVGFLLLPFGLSFQSFLSCLHKVSSYLEQSFAQCLEEGRGEEEEREGEKRRGEGEGEGGGGERRGGEEGGEGEGGEEEREEEEREGEEREEEEERKGEERKGNILHSIHVTRTTSHNPPLPHHTSPTSPSHSSDPHSHTPPSHLLLPPLVLLLLNGQLISQSLHERPHGARRCSSQCLLCR